MAREEDARTKPSRKYLTNIPGKHDIKELEKTAILSTAHIFREVLNVKVQNIRHKSPHKDIIIILIGSRIKI